MPASGTEEENEERRAEERRGESKCPKIRSDLRKQTAKCKLPTKLVDIIIPEQACPSKVELVTAVHDEPCWATTKKPTEGRCCIARLLLFGRRRQHAAHRKTQQPPCKLFLLHGHRAPRWNDTQCDKTDSPNFRGEDTTDFSDNTRMALHLQKPVLVSTILSKS